MPSNKQNGSNGNQDRNYDKPTGMGSRETLQQGGDLGRQPSRDLGNQQSGDLGNLQSGQAEHQRGSNRDRARSERQLSQDDIGSADPSER